MKPEPGTPSPTPLLMQAACPVRDVKVWGRTELGKRQSPHVPSLDHLETTALVLICGREKMEHSRPQNTVWALAGLCIYEFKQLSKQSQ